MDNSAVWLDFTRTIPGDGVWSKSLKQTRLSRVEGGVYFFECENTGIKSIIGSKKEEFSLNLTSLFRTPIKDVVLEVKKSEVRKRSPRGVFAQGQQSILTYEQPLEDLLVSTGINPRQSFDNYAVSPLNSVAYAAVLAVIDRLGKAYNPLFVWGGVGVGKTHLVQAAQRELLKKNTHLKCFFCKGESFTNEIITAIRHKATEAFRAKYRKLDLLTIDDIQFLAGKNTAQDEFFHTFESIIARGGQVILISDRPPYEIQDIQDRLRSRFASGLIVDISRPDFELRSAILQIKARDKGIKITEDAVGLLAEAVEDARSIEGALLSIYARKFAAGGGGEDSAEVVREDVSVFVNQTSTKKQEVVLDKKRVLQSVCDVFEVRPLVLRQKNRSANVAEARQVVMFFLREYCGMGLAEIARFLQRQDHTTIIHGVARIRAQALSDLNLQAKIKQVKNLLQLI